jgi:sugar phosphate isomerase/epimerase
LTGTTKTTRRQFLAQSAAWTAGACLLGSARAAEFTLSSFPALAKPSIKFPSDPRERVAVASYPFREFIAGSEHKSGNPTIELKNFAGHVSEKFGVRRIEPWSALFPSIDPKYLAEFRAAVAKAQCSVVDIAVDGEHSPYARDTGEREQAIAFSKRWIDVAVALGSPSIRTNIPPANDAKPDVTRLGESLARVAEYASAKNVVVHLENDNPESEDPFFLARVIDKVNSPWLRALPDFGNSLGAHSDDENYAYRGIDELFARAYGICHVKNEVVSPQGKIVQVDLAKTFGILKRHAYKGYCSIEYDSTGDPYKTTAVLIEKTVGFLS